MVLHSVWSRSGLAGCWWVQAKSGSDPGESWWVQAKSRSGPGESWWVQAGLGPVLLGTAGFRLVWVRSCWVLVGSGRSRSSLARSYLSATVAVPEVVAKVGSGSESAQRVRLQHRQLIG